MSRGETIWGGGDVDCGSANAFLTADLTRVRRAVVSSPAVVPASLLHSTALGGSVVVVVGPLQTFGDLNTCKRGFFRF